MTRIPKSLLLNFVYLLPFYVGNKFSQIFRLLQGGDALDRFIAIFSNPEYIFQNPWPSFNLQDLIVGLLFAGFMKLIVVVKGQNRKKFRKGMEYGSARWGTAKDIAPYVDKNPRNNIILTKT